MTVLLVEDEEAIARPLATLLRAEGWTVETACTAAHARELAAACAFDAALIDLGLPDGSGYEICRAVWAAGDAAIIILTARSDEDSVVRALEEGADNYVAKPFRARELVSRLRAVLRRRGPKQVYAFGTLTVDARSAQVTVDNVPVALTAQEYRLLLLMVSQAGRVWERGQLLQALWDDGGAFVEDNTLTVTVKRLREKLGREGGRIATVRGMATDGRRNHEKPGSKEVSAGLAAGGGWFHSGSCTPFWGGRGFVGGPVQRDVPDDGRPFLYPARPGDRPAFGISRQRLCRR